MTKNDFFARKAALLDPVCQVYHGGQFDWTTPEPFMMFNGWYYRFDSTAASFETAATNLHSPNPNFHRNLGVERYTLIPAGVRIIGTNDNSFIYGALPNSLVASDPRYVNGEAIYYERMGRLDSLQHFQIGAIRFPGTKDDCLAYFPPDNGRGLLLSAITSHGGCWTVLWGPTIPGMTIKYIVNTLDEINDAHEIRFTSGIEGLQPFKREWFDHIYLGLGTRGDTYGSPSTEATWCGAQGFIIPSDW